MPDRRPAYFPGTVLVAFLAALFLCGLPMRSPLLAEEPDAEAPAEADAEACTEADAEGSGDSGYEATDAEPVEEEKKPVPARLGEDVPLQERFFPRPRDFFLRSVAGERFQLHYERFDTHHEYVPTEPMDYAERRAYEEARTEKRPVFETVGYEPGAHSVRVWIPEGFDEAEIGDWGLFLYVSSDDAPDVPARFRDILTEHKLIFASPNGAGQDKPDVLRISLLLDTLKLMQTTYPRMQRRKTLVYGEGEAGQMALLTVMNFPDRFRNCAVVPVDTSLTMTNRYQAGTIQRTGRTGVEQTVSYFHPINAPYFSPTEYRKMSGVTFLYVLTNRRAIQQHYARIMDWVELSGERRFRPFWYPDGLTTEGMGVLLQALDGRRQVLDKDSIPEEMRPQLESDRRR